MFFSCFPRFGLSKSIQVEIANALPGHENRSLTILELVTLDDFDLTRIREILRRSLRSIPHTIDAAESVLSSRNAGTLPDTANSDQLQKSDL